jgi:lipoprotein-releasing system permease protein
MFAGLGFESRVATRFLREGRMQTLLIIIGVAAGVAVVAYISALIAGLQSNTLEKTLGAQAHVTLSPLEDRVLFTATDVPGGPAGTVSAAASAPTTVQLTQTQPRAQRPRSVANWQALVPVLQAMPEITAVSPMVAGAGLAQRGEAQRSIALLGVDLDSYDRIVGLRSKVVAGTARLGPGEAILGRELADDLGVRPGDRLNLVTVSSGGNVAGNGANNGAGNVTEGARVTALVDLGVRELNRRTVIVPLRTAQSLVGLPGGATNLDMTVADVWTATALGERLAARWPYKVESWQQTNAQLVSALNAQSVSTTLIRAVVMVVVVLGVASVLVVSVVQKRREIGILRAMGATQGQVQRVFLLQGLIVGALGSALGVVLAVGLIWAFTTFVRGSDGLPLFNIGLAPGLALRIAIIATACGVLAAVAPARRAARLDPAQAIRM